MILVPGGGNQPRIRRDRQENRAEDQNPFDVQDGENPRFAVAPQQPGQLRHRDSGRGQQNGKPDGDGPELEVRKFVEKPHLQIEHAGRKQCGRQKHRVFPPFDPFAGFVFREKRESGHQRKQLLDDDERTPAFERFRAGEGRVDPDETGACDPPFEEEGQRHKRQGRQEFPAARQKRELAETLKSRRNQHGGDEKRHDGITLYKCSRSGSGTGRRRPCCRSCSESVCRPGSGNRRSGCRDRSCSLRL